MKMRNLAIEASQPKPLPLVQSDKWIVIESDLIGEHIVIIRDKKWLKEAREANPDLAIYFGQEIKNLQRFIGDDQAIRAIHKVKKDWKAWIIRSQT